MRAWIALFMLVACALAQENLKPRSSIPEAKKESLIKSASKLISDFNFLLKALPLSKYSIVNDVKAKDTAGNIVGEIFSLAKPRGGVVYQVHFDMKVTPERVKQVLWDQQNKGGRWNPSVIRVEVEELDAVSRATYSETKKQGGGLIAGREFIDIWRMELSETNNTIAFKSQKIPELLRKYHVAETVPAFNFVSGYRWYAVSPTVTKLVYIINVDYSLKIVQAGIADRLAPLNTMKFVQALVNELESGA